MKRLLRVLSSRAASPLVVGFFLILYIGIAFFTDETLITLMEFIRRSAALVTVLSLLPLNSLGRIVTETVAYLELRGVLAGSLTDVPPGMFDETVDLSVYPLFDRVQGRLEAQGYKIRSKEGLLAAWRGVSNFPARMLYLLGVFCLFAGILISLTTRTSSRGSVVEREPLPTPSGNGGIVERIGLGKASGLILDKDLTIETAETGAGERKKVFGIYPPSLYRGDFVYPRYLGIGLYFRFSAPDLPGGYETRAVLALYPPGKEAAAEIPGSPYRIVFSLAKPDDGSDPYMTGRFIFLFKLLKGKEVVSSGSVPSGGEFVQDGYRLSFSDSRRIVITDFIRDYGVMLIWTAGILFMLASCIWLVIRIFFPRREMLFMSRSGGTHACSRAEGRGRNHGGIFHESLDLLEAEKDSSHLFSGEAA